MRIIDSPTVQLGLDLQYPLARHHQRDLEFVGIHRRHHTPPDLPVLPLHVLLAPFAL